MGGSDTWMDARNVLLKLSRYSRPWIYAPWSNWPSLGLSYICNFVSDIYIYVSYVGWFRCFPETTSFKTHSMEIFWYMKGGRPAEFFFFSPSSSYHWSPAGTYNQRMDDEGAVSLNDATPLGPGTGSFGQEEGLGHQLLRPNAGARGCKCLGDLGPKIIIQRIG